MRIWIGGPRLFGGWIRPGVSFNVGGVRYNRRYERAMPQAVPSNVVYVIEGGGHVKIGVSNDPSGRLATLQTGSAVPLRIVAAIPMPRAYEVEAEAHAILAAHRIVGEWFSTSKELAIAAVYGAASRLGVSIGNEPAPTARPESAEDFLARDRRKAAIAFVALAILVIAWFYFAGSAHAA